jgi:hypothetical protein
MPIQPLFSPRRRHGSGDAVIHGNVFAAEIKVIPSSLS